MISYRLANILLHVVLVSAFLAIFFFTYASKVEGEIVSKQSVEIVTDIVKDVKIFLPDPVLDDVNNRMQKIELPDMSEEDEKVRTSNDALRTRVIKFIVIALLVTSIVVWLLTYIYGRDSKESFTFTGIIIHNLIVLCFVGLTEYVFLDYFARNYISVDSNYVKYVALKTINERLG